MKKWIPIFMFFGIILSWFFMFLLQISDVKIERLERSGLNKLHGAFTLEKDTTISLENWHNNSFQKQKTKYINDNYFPRPLLTKLSNQYEFNLFNEFKANEIYQCKEGYLFRFYMDNFKPSSNFKGGNHIDSITSMVSTTQYILDSLGVHLIQVINPGKSRIMSEFLCERFKEDESKHINNYQTYVKQFEEKSINYIDFNKWFVQWKSTAEIPLFSKNGVHWTQTASSFAIDSLQNYMMKIKNTEYPTLIRTPKEQLLPWSPDVDAANIMNLLWANDEVDIPYYSYSIDSSRNLSKPKVLVISDSFWDAPSWSGFDKLLFANQEYWYYNRTFRNYIDPERPIKKSDYERLKEYDFIIVMSTEMNLENFGWGFYKNALDSFNDSIQ